MKLCMLQRARCIIIDLYVISQLFSLFLFSDFDRADAYVGFSFGSYKLRIAHDEKKKMRKEKHSGVGDTATRSNSPLIDVSG